MRRPLSQDLARLRRAVLGRYDEIIRPTEVEGVTVTVALEDKDVEELVLLALREARRPLAWKEMKVVMAGIAGEDRLRRIVYSLKARNEVAELTGTRYSLPEYVPEEEVKKVKNPWILRKIPRRVLEEQSA